jgi:hypothetical protein
LQDRGIRIANCSADTVHARRAGLPPRVQRFLRSRSWAATHKQTQARRGTEGRASTTSLSTACHGRARYSGKAQPPRRCRFAPTAQAQRTGAHAKEFMGTATGYSHAVILHLVRYVHSKFALRRVVKVSRPHLARRNGADRRFPWHRLVHEDQTHSLSIELRTNGPQCSAL